MFNSIMTVKRIYLSAVVPLILILFYYENNLNFSDNNNNKTEWIEKWWTEEEKNDNSPIRPFKIQIPEKDIQDLYLRLNISRGFASSFEDTIHEYGLNQKILNELLNFLSNSYNVSERQEFLNEYPQFVTKIRGMDVHFLHIKPAVDNKKPVIPFLLIHGWCSSVREFYGIISMFREWTSQKNYTFELVVPSLPGYGYSSAPKRSKFQIPHISTVLKLLMNKLGHQKFYVHGSDWGSVVASNMAVVFPESISSLHSNFCISLTYWTILKILLGSLYPSLFFEERIATKLYPLHKLMRFYVAESGYMHLMGSKPDTIGNGLDNSVEALLAFNLEKLSVGSNKMNIIHPNAGLEKFDWTLLMDVSLFYFWFPKSSATSARLYAENLSIEGFLNSLHNDPISKEIPCGCALFENDFAPQPPSLLRDKYQNLVHFNYYGEIGHFAALENDEMLAKDMLSFVDKTLQ